MKKCTFCEIIENKELCEEIILESKNFIVFTDKYRKTSCGSICLLVPKKHVENIFELNNGDELLKIIQQIGFAMQKAYNCKGIRIWTAVNKEAGQSIFHCHLHILACKSFKDRLIASLPGLYDLKYRILKFGNNQLNEKRNYILAEKIRKELDKIK